MTSAFPTLAQPGFQLDTTVSNDALDVHFSGSADMHAIEPLANCLAQVHRLATERRVQRVRIDFRKLEFMNSSCFKSFVSWIGSVQDLAPADRYQIEFLSNALMHWQRRSLNALRCFAMDLVVIQT
jgi:hypothetical protein